MYKVGLWEYEITPPLGCGMPGYGELRFGTGVKDKLFAKSFVIDNNGDVLIMIALDICLCPKTVLDAICDRITAKIPVSANNIMICCTHTHTGGPESGKSADGNDPELDQAALSHMIKMAADSAILAYNNRANAKIKYACGEVKGISFVRNYVMKDGSVRTNPGRLNPDIVKPYSEPDYSLPVLVIEDEKGELKGLIYDFSCHQDCVDGTEYSGDYSSVISKVLKEKFGQDFISLFFEGTAGNINHFNVKTAGDAPDHYVMMGKKIADELMSLVKQGEYVDGEIKVEKVGYNVKTRKPTAEEIKESRRIVKETVIPEGMKIDASSPREFYDYMMSTRNVKLADEEPDEFPIVVQVAKIGDVNVFGLQGEVFAQYADVIRKGVKGDKILFCTLANSNWLYVPIPELYDTIIYEAAYGSAMIEGEDSVKMIDKAIEIANRL